MDAIIAKCYGRVNSNLRVPPHRKLLFTLRVDAHTARRANLLDLIRKHKTIEALAEATDTPAGYLSQIKNGTREMGTNVARRIETKEKLPQGWMDTRQHGALQGSLGAAKLLDDYEKLPPLLQDHVAKLATELREKVEKIPEEFRDAVSAPPGHDADSYGKWERSIIALAHKFSQPDRSS